MKVRKLIVMAGIGFVAAGMAGAAEVAGNDLNQAQTPSVLLAFRPGFSPRSRSGRAPSRPPPVRREFIPRAPGPQFVWTPGNWAWDGRGWVWVNGAWMRPPRPRAVWVPGHWD